MLFLVAANAAEEEKNLAVLLFPSYLDEFYDLDFKLVEKKSLKMFSHFLCVLLILCQAKQFT